MPRKSPQEAAPSFEDLPDVLDVNLVAAYLHVGRSTAYALVRSRRLRAVRIGRRIVIPKSSLAALLAPPEHKR
jgi:excisionase family DNA binding protein